MFPSNRQVAYVLLTSPPLTASNLKESIKSVRLACLMCAASVYPEPGSNSLVFGIYTNIFLCFYISFLLWVFWLLIISSLLFYSFSSILYWFSQRFIVYFSMYFISSTEDIFYSTTLDYIMSTVFFIFFIIFSCYFFRFHFLEYCFIKSIDITAFPYF